MNESKREMYGITSRVPKTDFHYLLIDCDQYDSGPTCAFLDKSRIDIRYFYPTPHGYHFICTGTFTLEELKILMPLIPGLDPVWYNIGLKRGYWFLHNRVLVLGDYEYMRLEYPPESALPESLKDWQPHKHRTPPELDVLFIREGITAADYYRCFGLSRSDFWAAYWSGALPANTPTISV